jgi:uncharacterized membrane protein YbhN (UPF0104 family)
MFKATLYFMMHWMKKSIGFLLFVICSVAIYQKVLHDIAWNHFWESMHRQLAAIAVYQWLVLFILFCFNFLLEAFKWQSVIRKVKNISLYESLESVFVGQAFAFFTPNRIGEYAGRTLSLDNRYKVRGMAQMAWASYAQLLVTLLLGAVALWLNIVFYPILQGPLLILLKCVAPLIGLLALLLFFYERHWAGWFSFLNKVQIAKPIKIKLLSLSTIRYGIFILQYIWVGQLLHLDIATHYLVLSLAILFLCLSVLPTISVTELVVRGQLLLLLLAPFCKDQLMIVSLSTFIWGVNIMLPAIIGACLLLRYRINQ